MPETSEGPGDAWDPTIAILNIIETLQSASVDVVRSYDPTQLVQLDEYLRVHRDLRRADRLLFILASSAGARGYRAMVQVAWAVALCRSCLHVFLLRRTYDVGVALGQGCDPNSPPAARSTVPVTLGPRDASLARESLTRLRNLLLECQAVTERSEGKLQSPVPDGTFLDAFRRLARLSESILRDLSLWLHGPRLVSKIANLVRVYDQMDDSAHKSRMQDLINSSMTGARISGFPRLRVGPESDGALFGGMAGADLDGLGGLLAGGSDDWATLRRMRDELGDSK